MWYLWCGRLYLGGIGGILCKTQLLNIRGKWFRIGEMKRLFLTWMGPVEISGVVVVDQFHSSHNVWYVLCERDRLGSTVQKPVVWISESAISRFQIGEMKDQVLYMYAMYVYMHSQNIGSGCRRISGVVVPEYQEWLLWNISSGCRRISGVVFIEYQEWLSSTDSIVCRHSSLWTSRTAHSGHIPRSLELQRQLLKCQQQEW